MNLLGTGAFELPLLDLESWFPSGGVDSHLRHSDINQLAPSRLRLVASAPSSAAARPSQVARARLSATAPFSFPWSVPRRRVVEPRGLASLGEPSRSR